MGLDLQVITNSDGTIDEAGYPLLPAGELAVFPGKQLPEGTLHSMEDIHKAFCGNH
jgi:hypothetical protein